MDTLTTPSLMRRSAEVLDLLAQPEALTSLVATGEMMIENAAFGSTTPRCAWDSSGLQLMNSHRVLTSCTTLLIDIGGTHTKVAVAREEDTFEFLLDEQNDSLRPASPYTGPALQEFLRSLCSRIVTIAPELVRGSTPVRVGVIWSNQMTALPIETPALSGITGLVSGLHEGGYRKGEWFLDGLRDGDDIGREFQRALASSGIKSDVLVLGNDTVFTLFARPCSHAGVVISSGANCTLVGPGSAGESTIFNSELGGMLLLPDSMLSKGDRIFGAKMASDSLAIEELCGGAWFTALCVSHIEALSELPDGSAILPIRDAINDGALSLSNHALSALLRDKSSVLADFKGFDASAVETLRALTEALVRRAGALAAVLSYLSVASQVKRGDRMLNISLDSSMARHFVGYHASIEEHLDSLMPHDTTYSLHLVEPIKLPGGAEITVPMIGLARALREYRKPNRTEHPHDTPRRS